MLPFESVQEAEWSLGRPLTWGERLWLVFSARVPDTVLYMYSFFILLILITLWPIPVVAMELIGVPKALDRFKIQPKTKMSATLVLKCYKDVMTVFFLVIGPLELSAGPLLKSSGIRTSIPLPSVCEAVVQVVVYFLIEDYGNYWIHRLMHTRWGYDNIHYLHHQYTAPIGYASAYAHWAEVVILGIPTIAGPVMVPCHIITFWVWISLRQIEALDTHKGYDFPWSLSKLIPFYGGAEYHDYHHKVGRRSQSNFASVFTYCDYIYGTDKGYRYHRASMAKKREKMLAEGDANISIKSKEGRGLKSK